MKKKVYLLSIIIFLIDLSSKLIIKNSLDLYQIIQVIPNFFNITYVINEGAAFSILEGKQVFLIILGIILIFFLLKSVFKEELNCYKTIYYSFLLGGIFGNIFDRIVYHGVIDFLEFKIFNYQAPIFNLADIFIVFGTSLIIIESFLPKKNKKEGLICK